MDYINKFCEGYVFGKQVRTSFKKKVEYRARRCLVLVHTDICGPITPKSISDKIYFITFIVDYTRKIWVYFLKEKSEVFEVFKKFKAVVEKITNLYIKALWSDKGQEYMSIPFPNYCEKQGIKRFLTTYSPQQNGIIEEKNNIL